jgi:hypothetical protein
MNVNYQILSDNLEFIKKVEDVLNNEDGWKKYKFTFHPVPLTVSGGDVLKIELKSEEELSKDPAYKAIPGLSGYKHNTQTVSINEINWNYGHIKSNMENMEDFNIQNAESGLYSSFDNKPVSRDNYRNYVINHEVGHHLQELVISKMHGKVEINGSGDDIFHYRPDPTLTSGVMPIMLQLTRGKENLKPFSPNYFPLNPTKQYHEFYNIVNDWNKVVGEKRYISGGGCGILLLASLKKDMMFIIFLILLIILLIYYLNKQTNICGLFSEMCKYIQ